MWSLIAACVQAPEPPAEGPCAAFAEHPAVHAYCRSLQVQGELGARPRAELLAACPDEDCRFLVLDAHPEADPLAQAELCEEHAGRFAEDCLRHALDVWLRTDPTAEAIGELQQRFPRPELAARYAAAAVACLERGICTTTACEAALSEIAAEPGFCERVLAERPASSTDQPPEDLR